MPRLAAPLVVLSVVALSQVVGPTRLGAQAPSVGERAAAPKEPYPDLGRVFRDDSAPVFNELWFLGRYHGQYHWSDGSAANDDDYETRRFRIGLQARLFNDLIVHAQMVSGNDLEPFYGGFTELWLGWRFSEAFMLTTGQQKHRFTHDRNVSSRYLNYLERSMLTNMFSADYTPAVTASGRSGAVSYYGGVFSNATGRDMGTALTEYDSGYSLLGSVTLDLGDALATDSAFLNLCLLDSEPRTGATNLSLFDQGISTALIVTSGSFSLVSEVLAGIDGRYSDAIGLNLQPSCFLTDQLQAVARLQVAWSDHEDGLRAQRRYERDVGLTTGDDYQAGYLGFNYHLAGHRAKLMTGIEYATLGGEDVWTTSIAWRVFWGPHSRGPFPMVDTLPGVWR